VVWNASRQFRGEQSVLLTMQKQSEFNLKNAPPATSASAVLPSYQYMHNRPNGRIDSTRLPGKHHTRRRATYMSTTLYTRPAHNTGGACHAGRPASTSTSPKGTGKIRTRHPTGPDRNFLHPLQPEPRSAGSQQACQPWCPSLRWPVPNGRAAATRP